MPNRYCPARTEAGQPCKSPPLPGLEHCELHYVQLVIEPMNREMQRARDIILSLSGMKQQAIDKLARAKRLAQGTHTYGRWGEEILRAPLTKMKCIWCQQVWEGSDALARAKTHACPAKAKAKQFDTKQTRTDRLAKPATAKQPRRADIEI